MVTFWKDWRVKSRQLIWVCWQCWDLQLRKFWHFYVFTWVNFNKWYFLPLHFKPLSLALSLFMKWRTMKSHIMSFHIKTDHILIGHTQIFPFRIVPSMIVWHKNLTGHLMKLRILYLLIMIPFQITQKFMMSPFKMYPFQMCPFMILRMKILNCSWNQKLFLVQFLRKSQDLTCDCSKMVKLSVKYHKFV